MSKETANTKEVKEVKALTGFEEIYQFDISRFTTKKEKLSYLSWADIVYLISTKVDPNWEYEFEKFDNGNGRLVPYLYDDSVGYMVYTKVTINGKTKEMCLPVMENHGNRNFAKKKEAYTVKSNKYDTNIGACDMFDINKTLMRCLVKNVAMFGLGLKIYQGEDIDNDNESPEDNKPITEATLNSIKELQTKINMTDEKMAIGLERSFKKKELKELTESQGQSLKSYLEGLADKKNETNTNE